jgi:peptidoglycan/LPS O-acetylase OafA/YrhL
MNSPKNRIFGLDLMRAIAILMVLSSHSLWIYPPNTNLITQICQLFGYWGVEIFFVLSGFLIGRIVYQLYLKDDFSFAEVIHFLKRRWFRTLPNYYLMLLLNIGIAFLIGYAIESGWNYFLFLQNFSSPMLPFFTESWSLSIEEFAYLLLPIALFFQAAVVKPTNKARFFLLVILGFIAFFTVTKILKASYNPPTSINQWNLGIKSVVIFRLDAIFIGVLFSWISLNFSVFWKKSKIILLIIGLCLMGFLFAGVGYFQLTFDKVPFFWNVWYLPLTSLTFALFLPFLSEWKSIKWTFIQKGIVWISLISYSIYLLHYGIVLQLMKHYFPTEGMALTLLHGYTFIYLMVTFGLSYLCYRFYEKPMTDLRDK